jgi:hypothetical protein
MPKFTITFSRKRWEHLTKDIEVANFAEAEKAVAAYLGGGMDLEAIGSAENWNCGNLDSEMPEVEISNEDLSEVAFYPEDSAWPSVEPAPLPPPPAPPNKKFVVKVSREVTDLLSTEVEVEAPDKAAAIKAAEELYDQDKIALEYEMQLDDGKTTEYEVKSEADLEETPKEPPS